MVGTTLISGSGTPPPWLSWAAARPGTINAAVATPLSKARRYPLAADPLGHRPSPRPQTLRISPLTPAPTDDECCHDFGPSVSWIFFQKTSGCFGNRHSALLHRCKHSYRLSHQGGQALGVQLFPKPQASICNCLVANTKLFSDPSVRLALGQKGKRFQLPRR